MRQRRFIAVRAGIGGFLSRRHVSVRGRVCRSHAGGPGATADAVRTTGAPDAHARARLQHARVPVGDALSAIQPVGARNARDGVESSIRIQGIRAELAAPQRLPPIDLEDWPTEASRRRSLAREYRVRRSACEWAFRKSDRNRDGRLRLLLVAAQRAGRFVAKGGLTQSKYPLFPSVRIAPAASEILFQDQRQDIAADAVTGE